MKGVGILYVCVSTFNFTPRRGKSGGDERTRPWRNRDRGRSEEEGGTRTHRIDHPSPLSPRPPILQVFISVLISRGAATYSCAAWALG
jgi:hypothetical protein